jgi:hypothetical protein
VKGMIVYSFGWRRNGHSPCNIRLAMAAKRIIDSQEGQVLVFAQRTTASVLKELGVECCVAQKSSGYEGVEAPTQQAAELFWKENIMDVIPVAQPMFLLTRCIWLVRKSGFRTLSFRRLVRMIGWIGFDRLSVQPWTRGPVRLVLYMLAQMFFGYRPPEELSE